MSDQDEEAKFGLWIVGIAVALVIGGVLWVTLRALPAMPPAAAVAAKAAPSKAPAQAEYGLGLLSVLLGADGKVTLDGTVQTDRKKDRLLSQANVIWGSANVVDQIKVDAGAPLMNWRGKTLDLFARLKATPGVSALSLTPAGIKLSGSINDPAAKSALVEALRSFFLSNANVTDDLTVNPQLAPVAYDPNTLLNESVEFASGSATIPDSAKVRLALVANVLAEENRRLLIVGHTDNQGDAAFNRKLSLDRAISVAEFLKANGVAAANLVAEGAGPDRPIADNGTPEGRQKNRRIEFKAAPTSTAVKATLRQTTQKSPRSAGFFVPPFHAAQGYARIAFHAITPAAASSPAAM